MPTKIHTEQTFEEAIEICLLEQGGYFKGNPDDFDRKLAIDTKTAIAFLRESQPKEWEKLANIHGAEVEIKVINRLVKELELRGMLDVLRKGFTDYGVKFQMAYFKPETSMNPETEVLYAHNKLTVTRQLKYATDKEYALDMLLSLNGLPITTVELKNPFTGQTVKNAKKQYIFDRDPKEPLFQFKKRALVHFAVDTDEVNMTTKLAGKNTKYLPFNLGYNNGAGNPPNSDGYRSSYLWEQIWAKDSFMDIIGRFLHLETQEFELEGKKVKKETMIFPRYHQLDCVRKLSADAKKNGAGKNYLIQHSAGSGKSNSIAWLSYRLSSLHTKDDKQVYDSVIVVTDRLVLDQQLQDTIYQFEHKTGVIQKIDKDSSQLAEALEAGVKIIITTLQKFPFVIDKIGDIPAKQYAVIVDEAHSSQGGEASKKMREVLSAKNLEEASKEESETGEEDTFEDEIRKSMMARGKQKNLSFFGFTATPKAKTLEVFGEKRDDKKPKPFHLYSMRQAIEEGFILDVLKHYTTYKTFFKLSKEIEEDPNVNKKKASRAIARFLTLHPHNLAQKTEVIVEHFRQVISKKIGGKAKAMVVTSSRLHAVRYKQEFDKYIKEKNYEDIKTLIAFSGTVIDEHGNEYTEPSMNGFGMKQLPKEFEKKEYQILLVADKYQTGFDQPLLHTMYVDKKLSGVKAVQTLSRLNRTNPGKEDTFVLDFVNDRQVILDSFQPYYEKTFLKEETDPNHLYDLKNKIEEKQIIWQTEVDSFCKVYFKSRETLSVKDQADLYAYIDPAVERYKHHLEEEAQDDFKHSMISFTRLYSFLSQIMPFHDIDLEKLFTYSRFLLKKLPKEDSERFKLDDEVALEYYRLQQLTAGGIVMEHMEEYGLDPQTEAGIRKDKEELALLSEIIEVLNERFGTEFDNADKLFFDQIEEELVLDEGLSKQAKSNTKENFKYGFKEIFQSKVIERMDLNEEIFKKLMDEDDFRLLVENLMLEKVYERLNK